MNNLRLSVVYPTGYSPILNSEAILDMYPILDDTTPIKIGLKVAGVYTNNGRTQELLLTHHVFNNNVDAENFCKEVLPIIKNDEKEEYLNTIKTYLNDKRMENVGSIYYQ